MKARCRPDTALLGLVALTTLTALCACAGQDLTASDLPCSITTASHNSVVGSGLPGDPAAPEASSSYRPGRAVVMAQRFMVVTANPLASKAGCEVLRKGGSAVDAAVAAQAVLGLVEPQSSGLGGGAFMLHYDAASQKLESYDGRETAPAAATPNYLRWIDDTTDRNTPKPSVRASGRSIGTPGVLRMLEMAHADHGKVAWKELFSVGIDLARQGFPIAGRMAAALESSKTELARDAEAAAAYLNKDGSAKAMGSTFTLPAYADTLQAIADGGANAQYSGAIAQAIIAKIGSTAAADGSVITPGKTTLEDLAAYKAKKREPVCIDYRSYRVCGMGPPSSGGLAVAQALGILENFAMAQHAPTELDLDGGKPSVMGVHLVSESLRLAYADRDKYVADADFVPLPGKGVASLLDKTYLRQRAGLVDARFSMGVALPGDLGPVPLGSDSGRPEGGTSHITVVDRAGNVVSMTSTIESAMGSFHMTRGVMLNNQLTDFAFSPADATGTPVANRLAPGKRPRSSMAPALVFRRAGDGGTGGFVMATGSPGGGTIIQFVTKTLVGVLDWGLDAQQATSMVNFGAANNATTNVGGEHPNIDARQDGANDPLVTGLRAMRHTVSLSAQSSGVGTIVRSSSNGLTQLSGGADPRREGLVLGDTFIAAP